MIMICIKNKCGLHIVDRFGVTFRVTVPGASGSSLTVILDVGLTASRTTLLYLIKAHALLLIFGHFAGLRRPY